MLSDASSIFESYGSFKRFEMLHAPERRSMRSAVDSSMAIALESLKEIPGSDQIPASLDRLKLSYLRSSNKVTPLRTYDLKEVFMRLEDPLQFDWMSECLASFTPEQRKCMLYWLQYEIGRVESYCIFPRIESSSLILISALEEIAEQRITRQGSSSGRVQDEAYRLSNSQRDDLRYEIERTTARVVSSLKRYGMPERNTDDVEQALLELRAMCADPLQRLLQKKERKAEQKWK